MGDMDCRDVRERLLASEVGSVDEAARDHLSGCASCAEELRIHEEVWKLLLESRVPEAGPGFVRGVREKLHQRSNRVMRLLAPLGAAAAALVVVFLSVVGQPQAPTASLEFELRSLPAEDRALFEALAGDETWDLAENLETIRAMDAVGTEDELFPAEEKR